jgi:hypothetical protein
MQSDSLIGDFLIVAVYLGVCAAIAYALSEHKEPAPQPHNQPTGNYEKSADTILVIGEQNRAGQQKGTPDDSKKNENGAMKRWYEWLPSAQAWWAFFVAVFTGFLTYFTYQQLKFGYSADLSVMPMKVNPPCQLQWLITNNGSGKAEHLEIFNGVKNLPPMSKLEFTLLDSSKAMAEIKQQSTNWAMLLKSHQRDMNTMRANGVTEDEIEKSDKEWRASLPGLPRRVTMELPRNGQIPYGATVCENGVPDATTAPFVNVLLYSYEDTFGSHSGETCVSYFPGDVGVGADPHLSPCTEPMPTK